MYIQLYSKWIYIIDTDYNKGFITRFHASLIYMYAHAKAGNTHLIKCVSIPFDRRRNQYPWKKKGHNFRYYQFMYFKSLNQQERSNTQHGVYK